MTHRTLALGLVLASALGLVICSASLLLRTAGVGVILFSALVMKIIRHRDKYYRKKTVSSEVPK